MRFVAYVLLGFTYGYSNALLAAGNLLSGSGSIRDVRASFLGVSYPLSVGRRRHVGGPCYRLIVDLEGPRDRAGGHPQATQFASFLSNLQIDKRWYSVGDVDAERNLS